MQKINFSLLLLVLSLQFSIGQNIKGKIIDINTKESIPYANILINKSESMISNAEGYFTLSEKNSQDNTILLVSYLGYANQEIALNSLKNNDYTIALTPSIFELNDVNVSNKKPNAYEIMANVKANLATNYKGDGSPSKDLLFYRNSEYFNPKEIEVEIDKSPGFSKQALVKVNSDLKNFANSLIRNPPKEFTDILCNYYTANITKDSKTSFLSKLDVLKATKLKQEGSAVSSEELEKKAMNMMLQHLDSTKFYRVKSGLFGSRDSISLRKDFNQKREQKKSKEIRNQLTATKTNLNSFLIGNNFSQSEKYNFIKKPELYDYTYEGTTYTAENEFAYILSFKPRKSKAKYVGKLYISENDYAVLRAEFILDEGEKLNSLNLKLLLGIKVADNRSTGTIIYKKKSDSNGYYLQYATIERGQYFYLSRPLKFIELTREDKDVLSLDIKVEGNSSSKIEFLNLSRSSFTTAEIQKIKEQDFKYTTIKSYDPKIWKDYNAIEPLEEMKRFKAIN
ncbi:MAG: carboxypeptidase-like regulatory domain-containing protein [Flavobacteriaceae bacterium]|jgi:hypothetical protein|uniref:Carboxypeptidase-like regulatory domain-containing protein n=1 Tax=Flavobacterium kayseriense TaxID=2764714 RepID=A0ABR7J9V5_9FLAO|nr:carboxypeptidase-like regulatory domain-containing protein [Flavobacterium kayseriense]MBC5842322.1 carboxypeptidase-like regulatory domain-containing protein [Flavobacterium kayseriense]MBC5848852.1 carboxypeptidase-like regulatory domain-containing protein [Flavobacterium kayseriense]MBX9887272.1 carboxypeptidase-like regulatory domain-containing protein [Flavobacteriaceae bacterium]